MKKIANLQRWCSSPTVFLLTLLLLATPGFSQTAEMADTLRSEGKIYVVVSIMTVVLGGLIAYLVFIDRKTTRLEQKLEEKKPS